MRKGVFFIAAVIVMSMVSVGSAPAEPMNGFGLNGGYVSNTMEGKITEGTATGANLSYSSSGFSIGMDYQIALTGTLSLNPFLMSSAEDASGDLKSGTAAGHGIFGIQLRYWFSDAFLGAHVARYSEVLSNESNNTSGVGTGAGIAVGWESPYGGLFVMGQADSAKIKYSDADMDLSGFRISIGYRWK